MESDHYAILGLSYNATSEEIRNAYFHLARQVHPDVNPDPNTREQFLVTQKAYDTLSNTQRRAAYDDTLPPELRFGPAISVNIRYSQAALATLPEPQLTYALIEMLCTADLDFNKLPACHVCLVLDRSTSMNGARMDRVKDSAFNMLQQLRPEDVLSVVSFNDRADVIIPPTRAAAINRSDPRISLLQCGGGTEIFQGLSLGVEQLLKTRPTLLRQLILLTDGQTYGDDEKCLALSKEASQEGITISVLGIGHEWNDQLMDQLAVQNGGYSGFVAKPSDLDRFLQRKLTEMNDLYARGLHFEFESSPDVQLRYAFRLMPNTGPLQLNSPIQLGNIQHHKSIGILLEFLLPPLKEKMDELVLARGPIWMDLPGRSAKVRLMADLRRPVKSEVEYEAPSAVIIEAMSKLTLYRMQERARKEVEVGQFENATKHLRAIATHLLSHGDRDLARTVLSEAENIQQNHQFSKDGDKRIKYGTRALLLPAGPEHKL